MPSSAGLRNPETRLRLALAAVVLAALAVALVLALASTRIARQGANGDGASREQARDMTNTPIPVQTAAAGSEQPLPMRELLARFAYTVDVVAVLGLAAVLIVRRDARRREARR